MQRYAHASVPTLHSHWRARSLAVLRMASIVQVANEQRLNCLNVWTLVPTMATQRRLSVQ